MSKWQPIETAPKNGWPVIVATQEGDCGWMTAARYIEDEGWYEINNDPMGHWGEQLFPTHWHPFPAPPPPDQEPGI